MNRSKTFLFSFKDSSNTQNFTVKDSSASSSSFVHVFYYVQVFYVNSYYFRRFPSKPSKYRFPSSPCWENGWLCVSACFQMCLLHSAFYEKKWFSKTVPFTSSQPAVCQCMVEPVANYNNSHQQLVCCCVACLKHLLLNDGKFSTFLSTVFGSFFNIWMVRFFSELQVHRGEILVAQWPLFSWFIETQLKIQ